VTFDGGGAARDRSDRNTPVLAANVSGGLIKKEAPHIGLDGAKHYSGSIL